MSATKSKKTCPTCKQETTEKRPVGRPRIHTPEIRRKSNIALVYLSHFADFEDGLKAYGEGLTLKEAAERGLI